MGVVGVAAEGDCECVVVNDEIPFTFVCGDPCCFPCTGWPDDENDSGFGLFSLFCSSPVDSAVVAC
jgi:hypothetical protein